MKRITLAVVLAVSTGAFAQQFHRSAPPGQGGRGGGNQFRGGGYQHHGNSGWHGRGWRVPSVAPRWAPSVRVYSRLPMGVVSFQLGGRSYWYGGGVYYVPTSSGYAVTSAPLSATLTTLPPGAVMQEWNGGWYASSNGDWFQWDGWRSVWVVISAPW